MLETNPERAMKNIDGEGMALPLGCFRATKHRAPDVLLAYVPCILVPQEQTGDEIPTKS